MTDAVGFDACHAFELQETPAQIPFAVLIFGEPFRKGLVDGVTGLRHPFDERVEDGLDSTGTKCYQPVMDQIGVPTGAGSAIVSVTEVVFSDVKPNPRLQRDSTDSHL